MEDRESRQALKQAIVRIYHINGNVVGSGFLVADRFVLTCAHVVTAALGISIETVEAPTSLLDLDFPLISPGQKLKAKIVFWQPMESNQVGEDIAGLELEEPFSLDCKPARLVISLDFWDHPFHILGFPASNLSGTWASGVLRDQVANGWVQMEDTKAQGYAVQKGFSGAPVWDARLQGVAGMIVAAELKNETAKASFMIPVSLIVLRWTKLEQFVQMLPVSGSNLESQNIENSCSSPNSWDKQNEEMQHSINNAILISMEHKSSIISTSTNKDLLSEENTSCSNLNMELSDDFKKVLENVEVKFSHRSRENISLDDLFIFPDLRTLKKSLEDSPSRVPGEKLWDFNNRILIVGSEQSGKTTLAKKLFLDALSRRFLPLLIEGENIKSSKIEEQILSLIKSTYPFINPAEFYQSNNIVCIVDDLSANALNRKAKNKLIESLNSIFPRTILLSDESFGLATPDFSALDDYEKLEILTFNHVRRGKLIEKWVALEITEEVDEQYIWSKVDELRLHVESLVRKNIVPAKPFHILLFLQSFEMMKAQRLELTAHGHCYQYLIYQALERANVRQNELDTYLNVLAELGGAMLESPSESLDETTLDAFFDNYSLNFLPVVNREKVIRDLVNAFILQNSESGLKFRYRYLFYFFASKKLADSLLRGEKAKETIQRLVNSIHLERSSNIILFLTHHSKDPWILDEILYCVMEIFSEEKEITLEANSLSFLQDFIEEIPDLVLENRDAKQERLKDDEQKDAVEQKYEDQNNYLDKDEDLSDFMVKVNKLFRSIEVCGQILRNRLGSMERDYLESIYEESLSVSLRFLNIFLRYSEYVREGSIRKIRKTVSEKPDVSNSKIGKEVESFYLGLNYTVILSMLYKISFSLGSARGRDIYIKVTEAKPTPVFELIQEIIELQFEKKVDFNKIVKLHTKFNKNSVCDRFLKHIVLRHFYMHDVGYKDRQKLASKLGISMKVQRSLRLNQSKSEDD